MLGYVNKTQYIIFYFRSFNFDYLIVFHSKGCLSDIGCNCQVIEKFKYLRVNFDGKWHGIITYLTCITKSRFLLEHFIFLQTFVIDLFDFVILCAN